MKPNERKTVIICLIILIISTAVMVISTIIDVGNNGWEKFNIINIVPFIGMALAMIAILLNDKRKDDK